MTLVKNLCLVKLIIFNKIFGYFLITVHQNQVKTFSMNPVKVLFITSQALNTDKIPADCISTTTTTIYDILLSEFLIAKWRNSGADSAGEGSSHISLPEESSQGRKERDKNQR